LGSDACQEERGDSILDQCCAMRCCLVQRVGAQAPCPEPAVNPIYAERHDPVVDRRRGNRPEMRYACRNGIKSGGMVF
jgi:hypothetical protein